MPLHSSGDPDQLFAAAWSACFEGAIGLAARTVRVAAPSDMAIDAEVDLNRGADGLSLQARRKVSVPSLDRGLAQALLNETEKTCPYSKAVRGNVDVEVRQV
jgi:lipoyl-dependent peroxiredoxin